MMSSTVLRLKDLLRRCIGYAWHRSTFALSLAPRTAWSRRLMPTHPTHMDSSKYLRYMTSYQWEMTWAKYLLPSGLAQRGPKVGKSWTKMAQKTKLRSCCNSYTKAQLSSLLLAPYARVLSPNGLRFRVFRELIDTTVIPQTGFFNSNCWYNTTPNCCRKINDTIRQDRDNEMSLRKVLTADDKQVWAQVGPQVREHVVCRIASQLLLYYWLATVLYFLGLRTWLVL